MIPCALEFRNRSRRPAWICKQMHPQLMTLFYNLLFKKSSLQKNKNSIYGVNCTLQIIHIVLLYGAEALFFLRKYDTIAHFFHEVLFDFLRPRFSIFWGKIHALMEGNSRIRLPDRRIQQLHVKINQARIFSVSPSKVAALRGDPSTHSSSFLAKIISHRLLSTAQDDGSGNTAKHHPIPSFSPLKFR